MPRFGDRLMHAWNAFFGRDAPSHMDLGPGYSSRPDLYRLTRGNSRSLVTAIYNRIAVDCAAVPIKHVRLDEGGHFKEEIPDSSLNYCLNVEANLDQTGRAFMQDAVLSMLDEGVVALVPVETDTSPIYSDGFEIKQLRTAKIVQWYPKYIRVECYNENTGRKQEVTVPKKMCAIIENPFRSVMNEPNSTLQRLQRKLALLDFVDERTNSGKLNMIIQVPYSSRRDLDKQRAENRRNDVESQLEKSKYGIAWMDGTEKIVQLGQPLENNLLEQIDGLRKELYNQLGLTEEVFNGTADEQQMLNYNNRTLEPILSAIIDEMNRKFLSKKARTMKQSLKYFRDPFRLVPVNELAKIADVFTRNEILSSNEFRAILGFKPSDSQRANELINKNMPVADIGDPAMSPDAAAQPADTEANEDSMVDAMMNTPLSQIMAPTEVVYE